MDPLLHNMTNKAALAPCLQQQGTCRSPGMTSGLGGAGGCPSVHPPPPHEPELATAPFGSPIPCSSKGWADGEAAVRGTLCSAAAHSINLMRIFFFFFYEADGKIAIFCCLINTISKAENVQSCQVLSDSSPSCTDAFPRSLLAAGGAGRWGGRERWDTKGKSKIAGGTCTLRQQLPLIGQSLGVLLGELCSGSLRRSNSHFI